MCHQSVAQEEEIVPLGRGKAGWKKTWVRTGHCTQSTQPEMQCCAEALPPEPQSNSGNGSPMISFHTMLQVSSSCGPFPQ